MSEETTPADSAPADDPTPSTPAPVPEPGSAGSPWASLISVGFCVLGLLMAFHPAIFSGFERIQTSGVDPILNNYLLEHGLLWVTGQADSLWDAPFYYPTRNVLAYGDSLLGSAPIYWLLRVPFQPDSAFQAWLLTISVLNFSATLWFIRRCGFVGRFAPSVGAFLFAFGGIRVAQTGHAQLYPQFFTLLALGAVLALVRDTPAEGRRGAAWVALLFGSIVIQLYAGFYLGFFLCYALGILTLVSLTMRAPRTALLACVRRYWREALVCGVMAAILLGPLVLHSLNAFEVVGARSPGEDKIYLPRVPAWIYMGQDSWLWGWTSRMSLFEHSRGLGADGVLGLGVVGTGALVAWFKSQHARPWIRVVLIATVITLLLFTMFPGRVRLWRVVYYGVPGAKGIRAMSRVAILLLIPASLALTWAVDRLRGGRWRRLAIPLVLLCVLEQGQTTPSAPKENLRRAVAELVSRIDRNAQAFLVTYPTRLGYGHKTHHLEAMWASLETGVPTVNGYSGNNPPGWSFNLVDWSASDPSHDYSLCLEEWLATHNIHPAEVQVLSAPRVR